MRRTAAALGLLVAALALLPLACRREPPRPRNVIFILVDTLRADHLGVYGYPRPTSPNLDAFARDAVVFRQARSQAACTYPSVNSILTSRYPAPFLGQPGQALGIPAAIPSIAEVLQARGYDTVAISASAVVRKSPSRFNPGGGFGRGFGLFHEDCVWKSAACVNRAAFEHLRPLAEKTGKPLFLYLHYLDPHGPYAPPSTFRGPFSGAPGAAQSDKNYIRAGNPNPIGDWLYKGAPDPGLTPADRQALIDRYDDEIAFFDSEFAHLLARLREAGLLEDSILVVAADHGEEFLEHGHIKHCRNLFDTSTHTPLLMRIPGVRPGQVAAPVENVDIVPTLLDYLGIETAGLTLEGTSLRPLLSGKEDEGHRQYASQGPWRAVSDGRFKLIHDLAAGNFALYDLQADPGEQRDVLRAERRTFHRLREDLTAWLGRAEGQWAASESVKRGNEAEKKLRSLGYLE